jgi:hypothetical protein
VQIATRRGKTATVSLPTGQYRVLLTVQDSGGLESTMDKVFVVGTASASGTIAVISQPLSVIPANPAPGKNTTIILDAAGSTPSPGATLSQYVWAIIALPDQSVQGSANGRVARAQLRPGQYQVGLLVVDSNAQNVVAKKNITVGDGGSGITNLPPTIPAGLVLNGVSGGSVTIPGITDPNGDLVTIQWEIRENGQPLESGIGSVVTLQDVEAGEYELAITATDSKGARSTGTATLRVSPGEGGAGGGRPPPPPPPSLRLPLRLPSLTVAQGTLLEVDAASAGVPLADISKYTYDWTLQDSATKAVKTTQNNTQVFRNVLRDVGQFDLTLTVTEKAGGGRQRVTSVVKTLPATGLPSLTAQSTCGPFTSSSTQDTQLSCPRVSATGPNSTNLQYAWRVANIETATIKTAGPTPTPNFGRLDPGVYVVEVAVGANGPPQSSNSIYFLSSVLQVTGPGGATPAPPKAPSPAPTPTPTPNPIPPPKTPSPAPTPAITPVPPKTTSGLASLDDEADGEWDGDWDTNWDEAFSTAAWEDELVPYPVGSGAAAGDPAALETAWSTAALNTAAAMAAAAGGVGKSTSKASTPTTTSKSSGSKVPKSPSPSPPNPKASSSSSNGSIKKSSSPKPSSPKPGSSASPKSTSTSSSSKGSSPKPSSPKPASNVSPTSSGSSSSAGKGAPSPGSIRSAVPTPSPRPAPSPAPAPKLVRVGAKQFLG